MKTEPRKIFIPTLILLASLFLAACASAEAREGVAEEGIGSSQIIAPADAVKDTSTDSSAAQDQVLTSPGEGPIIFERINTSQGLSFPLVRDIAQDRSGYIWFATDSGLNRYDGYGFTVYREDYSDQTSLRTDAVYTLFVDSDGIMWLGTAGGLDRYDQRRNTFEHIDTRGQVYTIIEDHAGILWVGFWHGLYGYDRSSGEIEFTYQQEPSDLGSETSTVNKSVTKVYEDQLGYLWISIVKGLDRLDPDRKKVTQYRHDPDDPLSLGDDAVIDIYEDHQGNVWVGTGSGLDRYDRSTDSFHHYRHDPGDPFSLVGEIVTSILEDHTGKLWIGTTDGLNRYDPGTKRFYNYQHEPGNAHSLSENTIVSLLEDQSGVIWVGTANGINKYNRRGAQFSQHTERQELFPDNSVGIYETRLQFSADEIPLSDNLVTAIYEDQDGVLWVGTTFGGLNKIEQESGILTVYRHDPNQPNSLIENNVGAVYQDSAGVLWVGMDSGWLERYDPQTGGFNHIRQLTSSLGIAASILSISEDADENLWIGTQQGLFRLDRERESIKHFAYFMNEPEHWQRYGSLSHHIITTLHIDEENTLWAGTWDGGINVLADLDNLLNSRFSHFRYMAGDATSLSHEQILAMLEQSSYYEGLIWVGTGGGGLNRYDRSTGEFKHYTLEDGLLSNTVSCILIDDEGFLWLGTPKGLSRFDPRTETFRNYDERDGVGPIGGVTSFPGACIKSHSGEMFFGGDGLISFYPQEIRENLKVPPIVITAVNISNQPYRQHIPNGEQINLSDKQNFLSFEFAALDYTISEKNQYAFMMEGLDMDWVFAGTRRHVDYPDLKPGNYVFKVKGTNNDGVWNEEGVSVAIRIDPPLWQTWPVRIMFSITVVLLSIGLYRQRVKGIQERSRQLEEQVEQRTIELRQETEQRILTEEALRKSEMEKAVNAERSRLARELHDSVTQALYSATLLVEAGKRVANSGDIARAREFLNRVGEITQQSLKEMRLLVYELRPLALEEEGLEGALQQRLDAVERRAGVDARLVVEGALELPEEIEEGLFRIAFEALNNALKHADSSSTTIVLKMLLPGDERQISLQVADNGVGFDPLGLRDRGGLGITSMRERVERLGGELEITSTPGEGTLVKVIIPISKEESDDGAD